MDDLEEDISALWHAVAVLFDAAPCSRRSPTWASCRGVRAGFPGSWIRSATGMRRSWAWCSRGA